MTVFVHAPDVFQTSPQQRQHLGFLLDQFCQTDPHISHAIAISGDGIPMAASAQVSPQVRDQIAASAVGHMSLANGMAGFMQAGAVERVVVNLDDGWVIIQQPHQHVVLIVLADRDAELGLVDDELARLGEAIGPVLDPGPRYSG
jgi:predicted regulator of Ras-like GTPase activity (Roadblock/LC7/MglB family)